MNLRTAATLTATLLVAAGLSCECTTPAEVERNATNTAGMADLWTQFAATATGPAVQAWTAQATGTHSSALSLIITNTPRPRRTPASTGTPTPSPAIVHVNVPTNCRTGPSIAYDVVTAFEIGQTAEVVGRNTRTHYWVVKIPGGGGNCWLWDQYVTVTGNTRTLPEMKPPPVPTATRTAPLIPIRPTSTTYVPGMIAP